MGNIIKFDENMKLPAHLQDLSESGMEDWASGQVSGFPVLSIDGKVFHIVRGDDSELITNPNDEDEAASSVGLVVLKTHKGVARVFYKEKYERGSQDKPTCYSNDGIRPEDDAEEKQARQCKTCPQSQWGSRITESGKKGKACNEVKRLAVAEPGYEDDPMLLRVPPTSLTNWDNYLRKLDKLGFKPNMLVTKVGFDPTVSHQLLTFKPVGVLDEKAARVVKEMQDNPVVEAIIGTMPTLPASQVDDEPAPEPKERTRASRKPKDEDDEYDEAADEPEEKPRRKRSEPEEDEDEEPEEKPASRRRRRVEPEPEEKPASRRRAAPKDEEEDEPPRRRRRAPVEEDDEPEEKPKKSAKESTTVVDEDDDLEGELNDMLDELDFDD